jgi:hypothetical protein
MMTLLVWAAWRLLDPAERRRAAVLALRSRGGDAGGLTRGVVKHVLTKSSYHPHGIKVRL